MYENERAQFKGRIWDDGEIAKAIYHNQIHPAEKAWYQNMISTKPLKRTIPVLGVGMQRPFRARLACALFAKTKRFGSYRPAGKRYSERLHWEGEWQAARRVSRAVWALL